MLTRLKWLLLTSILKVNADQEAMLRKGAERPILVKMDPEQVVETFKTILYSPYFKDMTNQIATKAVEHYISEVLQQHNQSTIKKERGDSVARQRPKSSAKHVPQQQQLLQSQQQKHEQKEVEKAYNDVNIEQEEKINIPVAVSMILTGSEPHTQPHKSTSYSDSHGQANKKLKYDEPAKTILSEQVAYALLKDPSPDGDLGLGLDSLEQPTSPKPPPPPKKINGMYFRKRRRRLLSK